eukprot:scaffold140698_cov33-Tisochrysis_lutea.AAC.3
MQDVAWLFQEGETSTSVGYTSVPMEFGYFPCKNDLTTAAKLSAAGVPAYSVRYASESSHAPTRHHT